jgi:predicted O-methyltransferase YrrM
MKTGHFDKVQSVFETLPYMSRQQAAIMRKLVVKHDVHDILEIGFFHGKSSAYLAAILEDLGRGHLVTIDRKDARDRQPNIEQLLSSLELAHRVTPVYAHRSHTWELANLIRKDPRPGFDLCYLDGGHTWDDTGFGFLLVDMLLRPGGWIVFDDLGWTIEAAMRDQPKPPRGWRMCSPDERSTPAVGLVFDLLVPHLGYTGKRTANHGQWGIAQKPVVGARPTAPARGPIERVLNALVRRRT